ncbi:MAG: rhomboid family intramembrane serine protease [Betaproteobacteria bacterium]|nr:rhomboid family intramembrane serine protease [Betaproteobacteria bacterium]
MALRLIPGYWPVYGIAAASICGALSEELARAVLSGGRWSPQYLLLSPFIHGGAAHLILNIMGLHYIGGQLILPLLGARRFLALFAAAAVAGNIANNIFTDKPAVGISAAVLGMLSCALYKFGRAPMRLLLLHDIFRLRPFPLWKFAAFAAFLDVAGIILGWGVLAHWAHLAGFAVGGVFGWFIFRRRPPRRWTVH